MQTGASPSSPLPVMESFYTLQGEGFHQGRAAYFIRLGGCDVGCVWCDVKESWDASLHPLVAVDDIVSKAMEDVGLEMGGRGYGMSDVRLGEDKGIIAVVTGGEPLLHDLTELTLQLKQKGFRRHIETSASSPLSGDWDWICLSPKKFKAPLPEILPLAHELKIIVYNKHDLLWAEEYAAQVSASCKLYLQPEWEQAAKVTPLIIDYIKAHPEWELSLQIHKYIQVP